MDDPGAYGRDWADVYDDRYAALDPSSTVDFLAGLTGDRPVLELAIGTGRVALPLAARGMAVEGVDASPEMVAQLRAKPGGAAIPVTLGDMADVPVQGPYGLVYLVFNTLFGLTSQQRQVDCFANVARVLAPGGRFVIECFVPDLSRYRGGQLIRTTEVSAGGVTIEAGRHDPISQRIAYQVATLGPDGLTMRPLVLRYSWPSELDLMARLAGLDLAERYADWDRRPFDASSVSHVSVYQLGPAR